MPPECFNAGLTTEETGYYASELRSGRWVVAVCCHAADIAGVLGVFGRHGGSVCVPPEVRDGRC